jgi:hypothetical protein
MRLKRNSALLTWNALVYKEHRNYFRGYYLQKLEYIHVITLRDGLQLVRNEGEFLLSTLDSSAPNTGNERYLRWGWFAGSYYHPTVLRSCEDTIFQFKLWTQILFTHARHFNSSYTVHTYNFKNTICFTLTVLILHISWVWFGIKQMPLVY